MLALGMLTMIGGCEVFQGIAPGFGFGVGNTLASSIVASVLGLLGIPV